MARGKEEFHEFEVARLQMETAKAYCLFLVGLEEPVWIPKSQCELDRDSGWVYASNWIVQQKSELLDLLKRA